MSSGFIDFLECPICFTTKGKTRYYVYGYYYNRHPKTGSTRFIYCDSCKVVRVQTYSQTEGWHL